MRFEWFRPLSHMLLPFFYLLFLLYLLLHILYRLLLFYQLATLCRYRSMLCLGGLNSALHCFFPSGVMCKSKLLIWSGLVSRKCVQAIMRWTFVIVRTCDTRPTLVRVSNADGIVVDLACLCRAGSVLRGIFPSFADKEVKYEKYLSRLVRRFDGKPLLEIGSSPLVLRRRISHLYLAKGFD